MKILIIRFSSIGDIVLTTPIIRTLKTQLNDAEIHFVTKKEYNSLIQENPYLDKIHLLDNSMLTLGKDLRKEKFDLIVDLHNNLRSRMLSLLLGVKTFRIYKLNFKKWLFTNFKVNLLPNVHVVDRYLKVLLPLGVKNDQLGLEYFIPEKDEMEPDWLPEPFREGYAAVIIGGKFATKKLPRERLIELCDRINKPVVLIGGKEEVEMGKEVEDFFIRHSHNDHYEEGLTELGKKTRVFNVCGKLSINQSASLVRQARWVFTHDTGLMHIAAAFKKDLFTIWGNTVPEFGMYPYRTKFTIFENKKLSCRPCSKLGHDKCPKGHFKCMQENTFDFYLPD